MNILIAEDESDFRNLLKIQLEEEGFDVYAAKDGVEALELIKNNELELAILDVMMPRLDGFNLLRKIREISLIPVIFLTARGDEMDKVLGLGIGADDYLVKPVSMQELIARVHSQIRRNKTYISHQKLKKSTIEYKDLVLDKDGCCLYKNNILVELNAKEYRLLEYLMENPSRVFTKKQLYQAIWDEDIYYDGNTIMVHISHIRNKIEENPKNPEYIKTIRGIGYKFNPQGGNGV